MSKLVLDVEQMKHLSDLGLKAESSSLYYWIIREGEFVSSKGCYVIPAEPTYIVLKLQPYKFIEDAAIRSVKCIPAFTLQDILSLLPKKITASEHQCSEKGVFFLYIDYEYPEISYSALDDWCPGLNELNTVYINKDTELIDAAYEMLCWCLENGYIEKDF